MSERTHLDEIVKYPDIALRILERNRLFVSLLIDIPNASLDDPAVRRRWDAQTNNFNFIDGVVQDTMSFCCVDTSIEMDGGQIKWVDLELLIGVHKQNMKLYGTEFSNLTGNRRDNLLREADYSLRTSRDFGIGAVVPSGRIEAIAAVNHPDFACKLLRYNIATFAKGWNIEC